jgi:thiol-disulfide isomerase/thioredoxin
MMNKVMKFHADWCGPCKNYSPIFEQVTKNLEGWEVEEYNIETPKGTEMSVTYGINSVPSTVIIVDGKEPRKLVGTLSATDLAKELV